MYKRMRATRRKAFLRALAATGNVTLAGERTGVSRSWVYLERRGNAEFDAACRTIVAAAKARLREAGDNLPPAGWGFLGGMELVVRKGKGGRVQVARARAHQWTAETEDRFLLALSATCNVDAAAAEAGMSPGSAFAHRKRWAAFARKWDEAARFASIRLDLALIQYAGNPFSSPLIPDPAPIPPIGVHRAMHSQAMHQRRTHGIGGRPGRVPRHPTLEQIAAQLLPRIEALERGASVGEDERAGSEREFRRRRRSR